MNEITRMLSEVTGDWLVSGDAMRWTPPEDPTPRNVPPDEEGCAAGSLGACTQLTVRGGEVHARCIGPCGSPS